MIELYAITDDPAPPDPPLQAIPCDGLTALCAPAEPREATPEELWRHEAVVEGLMAGRDLLPVRFGTLIADEDAATRALSERRDELLASLDRVRGAVELAVRVQRRGDEEPGPSSGASGRDYLEAKVRRSEAASALHDRLAAAAREGKVQAGPELLRGAYLVDRTEVDAFVSLVARLQREHDELDLLCTGPWPPYSFAER